MTVTRKGRLVRLLVALTALALVAAACGGDNGAATTTTTPGTADDTTTTAPDGTTTTAADGDGELATGPGFDGTTIRLGIINALTGPVGEPIGIPVQNGTETFYQALNAKGGIAGQYRVELVVEDNVYDAPTTIQKYNQIKNQVVMFGNVLGTPPTNAVLAQLKSDKIVAAAGSLDAEWVREENLVSVGAPYQVQFINAAAYLMEEQDFDGTMCIIAAEGPYGDAGVDGLRFAAEQLDFQIGVTARFVVTDQEYTAQIQQLRDGGCDAVFITAVPSNLGGIIGGAAALGYTPQWIGQSPVWVNALGAHPQLGPILAETLLLASEGTTWGDESTPGMAQLIADVEEFRPGQGADQYFAFGYTQAWVVSQLLEKAVELGDLSRDGILDALKQLGPVSVGGLLGDYVYGEERTFPRTTTIFRINPEVDGFFERVARIESDAAKAYTID